ncbi:hypothetical protein C8F01DRAFT_1142120 [Mycena amicta]|nr:hypothetical protein C8F01DRAFT_1142120 [Mycena amicta]
MVDNGRKMTLDDSRGSTTIGVRHGEVLLPDYVGTELQMISRSLRTLDSMVNSRRLQYQNPQRPRGYDTPDPSTFSGLAKDPIASSPPASTSSSSCGMATISPCFSDILFPEVILPPQLYTRLPPSVLLLQRIVVRRTSPGKDKKPVVYERDVVQRRSSIPTYRPCARSPRSHRRSKTISLALGSALTGRTSTSTATSTRQRKLLRRVVYLGAVKGLVSFGFKSTAFEKSTSPPGCA